MAYQNSHVKVSLIGTSMDGNEEWTTSFRMGQEGDGGGNFGIPEGFAEVVANAWQAFFTNANNGFHSNWKTTHVKCSIIQANGKTDLNNVATRPYAAPISGGMIGGILFPPQVSLVAQLRAQSPVGLGSKGRMYLPGLGFTLQGNGQIANADAQKIADGLRTFFDTCEAANPSPGYVINASEGRVGVPFAPPVHKRVQFVRVGTVYDTQRRRRNGLNETYMQAALAA